MKCIQMDIELLLLECFDKNASGKFVQPSGEYLICFR